MLRTVNDFEGFDGYVKIDFGKYRKRMAELSCLSLNINKDGMVETTSTESIKEVMKIYDLIHDKVVEVKLIHIKSGLEFSNLEDLEDFQEYGQVMAKLVELFSKGDSLGNC